MKSCLIGVNSEIGTLRKVLVHTPGPEVELMSPQDAAELLYNDILSFKHVAAGHKQLKSVLSLVSEVYEVSDCLQTVFENPTARQEFLNILLEQQGCPELYDELLAVPAPQLVSFVIGGLPLRRNNLASWLSTRSYALVPLPNLYFTRDTSMVVGLHAVGARMASPVRSTESLITRALYRYHPDFASRGLLLGDLPSTHDAACTIEGGDILIVRENLFLVGISERTTPKAVDALIEALVRTRAGGNMTPFHVLCVMLPLGRSTIHLDMIFTIVNHNQAIVYEPAILGKHRARVVCVHVNSELEKTFTEPNSLLEGLQQCGVPMEAILCGGDTPLHQQREQWNSGANMFAFAPGKVISYEHEHTLRACEAAGFQVIGASEVLKNPGVLKQPQPLVVTIEGSELSRGGGGPRCMTCPLLRDPL